MAAGFLGGGNDALHRCVRLAKAYVVRDCVVEKINVLENKAVVLHKVVHAVFANISLVQSDFAGINIPEAGEQMTECRLAAAARPYNGGRRMLRY